ncbi:methylmalonyl-CoA mutase family protein [Fervidibacillus albus]|uniref:Methylmalonyl-CoA mutase family protein n=1 Tax=Fervidibacillus albus TaxID=2980026 RepID=A0A9E8LW81_9BACI|nr:methylmalonyl-CoA mutase family protein [Fervidibacillus albus]WAA10475.1 methylmalonyl-CoA mutase family protein [Fervidibacillus albus]
MKDIGLTLNIQETKAYSFPDSSYSDWLKVAEKTVKGKSVSDYMTNTYEQIDIQPLYTKEDIPENVLEIQKQLKKNPSWSIVQKISGKSIEEINEQILKALQFGSNTVSFNILPNLTTDQMEHLFKNIPLKQFPFFIDGKMYSVGFYVLLADWFEKRKLDKHIVSGFIGTDPVHFFMHNPGYEDWENCFSNWADGILYARNQFPNLKTIFVNSSIFEQAGAHSIQQLAYSLLEIVEYVEYFREKGMDEKEVFQKIVVAFSVSSDFFMEVAKLRAFRYLWKKLLEAYGVDEQIHATIFAQTSVVNKTKTDPYMNLIRSGNEAFSSIVGQVDYLSIRPFDEVLGKVSEKGTRLSLNTHHILKEEAGLAKVCDPAAGSYFIERLTQTLIERSWAYFVDLDEKGGFLISISKGIIQRDLNKIRERRQRDFNQQKKVLVGTNRYANPHEDSSFDLEPNENGQETVSILPLDEIQMKLMKGYSLEDCVKPMKSREKNEILPPFRLSAPLERCRKKLEQQIKGKNRIVGFIINGDYVSHKRIIDFISNIFSSVGLDLSICTEGRNLEKVNTFLEETDPILYGYLYCKHDVDPIDDNRPVFYVHEQSFETENKDVIRQGKHLILYPGIDQISFYNEMIDILGGKK